MNDFLVLYSPADLDDLYTWRIVRRDLAEDVAVKVAKKLKLAHGDLVAVLHIDDISNIIPSIRWLGIYISGKKKVSHIPDETGDNLLFKFEKAQFAEFLWSKFSDFNASETLEIALHIVDKVERHHNFVPPAEAIFNFARNGISRFPPRQLRENLEAFSWSENSLRRAYERHLDLAAREILFLLSEHSIQDTNESMLKIFREISELAFKADQQKKPGVSARRVQLSLEIAREIKPRFNFRRSMLRRFG